MRVLLGLKSKRIEKTYIVYEKPKYPYRPRFAFCEVLIYKVLSFQKCGSAYMDDFYNVLWDASLNAIKSLRNVTFLKKFL